ncbi:imidazole glycerol phosphate synthase subunit HisH [Rathayibacter toxicus]|uniref:imidazole glycerol phosphate synthase subunit HisH n=1 Tax=Rathayibacter toxicus TaxID=145458 RepID=UPI000CE8BB37|nr:imidazole glycerol phosphate synthase subunit HisH [Rathayibacter toxicus]PPI55559.1 imidazole glycerol phosphate synthase subunit HisH [Rathayibacter toxicus]QOD09767.1 imidazole glycerol phosphate synthase subunit HisH [Rathayibacter toxicus]
MSRGRPSVVVYDYGSGNVHSAVKALERVGAEVELTADRQRALNADGLLVPGVGAFDSVMTALTRVGGGEIIDTRLAGGRAVLGICVGMQVLFERGVERGVESEGLAQWPGTIDLLPADVLPHMGWNTVSAPADSVLFDGISDERFYFVHSYGAGQWSLEGMPPFPQPLVTWAEHGGPFVAAVENGPLSATQFHPEKSGAAGLRLLANWLGSLRKN